MEVRWSISGTKDCGKVSSQYLSNILLKGFIFTFGFARSSQGVVRAMFDMDHIASDELGNLVRFGIVLEVHFTYAVLLVQQITILLKMFNVPSMTYATAGP